MNDSDFATEWADIGDDDAAVERMLAGLELAPAPPASRLLDALTFSDRFKRFGSTIATMLDVAQETAETLLAGLDHSLPWGNEPGLDGISTLWVAGGPATRGCVRGFVRIPAGASFPEHDHLGVEETLVLQGHMVLSSGEVIGPGESHRGLPGEPHGFVAMDGGSDLLYFAVVREGITIGDVAMRHRDEDA